jgi:catecholate siderophore receptor
MSGRRSKQIRKKIAAGALVACSTFITKAALADDAATAATKPKSPIAELPLRRFDIAAGTLDEVIPAYEAASGVDVRFSFPADALSRIGSGGVSGTMPSDQALDRILDGTGIDYRFDGRRVVTITMQHVTESIDVTAATPEIASPKFTRPLLETPRTVTVIKDEVFTAQGATTLRDVLRNTPGITFQAGEGGGGLPGDTFSMRGFSAGNDITLDGVREVGSYTRDAFNLEQVEVMKGPSSSIAGRGATGGSINLVTKSPKTDTFTRATVGAGNAGYTRLTADANTPLDSVGGALRINAMATQSGVQNRDVVENQSWGVAPSLAFGIGKPTRFTLAYQHLSQDNVPDYGLPWAALDAHVDQSNFYGLEHYDYEDVTNDTATATLERDLRNRWILRNVSRWAQNHRDSAITAPRPPNRQLQQRLMDHGQLANQTSISGSFGSTTRHDVVFGIEVARETTFSRRQAQTANQPQTNIDHPDPSQSPIGPMPQNIGNPEETTLNLAGVYALDTVRLGAKWEASGSLRFDSVDADFQLDNLTTQATTRLQRDDRMLSWNAGVVYKPKANASIYASAGTSFNPSVEAGTVGAGLSDAPTAANNVNLDPEKSRNFELGTKWELGAGKAMLTAAVFRTEKTNARTRSVTTEPFVLDGKQRVDGVELGVSGKITDDWTIFAGYANLQSEFVESNNPVEEGAALAFTPENSFNVWTDARLTRNITIGGGAQYMDAVFRNAANTAEVPSYWLVGAMAAYAATDSLTLRLNVNNLTNTEYVDRVGGGHYIPGAGRTMSITAELDF